MIHFAGEEASHMAKVYIDGSAGTIGLRIHERLAGRRDLTLLQLPEAERKNIQARSQALNEADVAFLCLPDEAAVEAVSLVHNERTVLIDTSTAHRVQAGWTYGFPELPGQRERIAASRRIANPGCHASGFVALVAPLVEAGLLAADARLSCFSLTGYSGGGKKMIAEYEAQERSPLLDAPRMYALDQQHKHLPEMAALCGLVHAPVFSPVVADYFCGMEVVVPLCADMLCGTPADIRDVYRRCYPGPVVRYAEPQDERFLSACAFAGRDDMRIGVYGSEDRLVLTACFDNLGKGASGAAIQNMNIVLGAEETLGLHIGGQTE